MTDTTPEVFPMAQRLEIPHVRWTLVVLGSILAGVPALGAEPPRFSVPPGFTIEKVAGPPLVKYPLFASFDEKGRRSSPRDWHEPVR